MNYLSLYNFIHDISQNINQTVTFFHGRKEVLNLVTQQNALYIHCLPFTSTGSFVNGFQKNETWNVILLFYQLDEDSSMIDQNEQDKMQGEIRTLSITEQSANRFLTLAHGNSINDELSEAAELLTITGFTKETAIKDTASMLTGTVLTMTIQVPDNFNYCELPTA